MSLERPVLHGKTVMNKKVALVNPGRNEWAAIHPPIHLGHIAACLEAHGIEVHILDELAGQNVIEDIDRLKPDFVGITATTPMAPDAYRIAAAVRKMGIKTVMGGKHAMILPEEALKHVDIVVIGEGEQAMLDIVEGRTCGPMVYGNYLKDLDDLPTPAWHLMNMDFYISEGPKSSNHLRMFPKESRMGALLSMRGCPYNCIFCYNSWRDTPLRFHSAERVVREVEILKEKYGVNAVFFMDDDMAANKKRFRDICTIMIERKTDVLWGIQASVNSIDRELLELGRKAGLIHVGVGCESGSPRILKLLKKGRATVEKNAQALKLLHETGVKSWATFMIGNPTETYEDIKMTFDFIKSNPIDGLGVLITTPFPGTELWKWCEEQGLIPKDIDWSVFTTGQVSIPANTTFAPEEIQRFRNEMHFYFYPSDLWKVLLDPVKVWNAIKHPIEALKKLPLFNKFKSFGKT